MSVFSDTEIKKIAKLSCIALSQDEVTLYQKAISTIIGWIEELKAVDTVGVEPMHSVIENSMSLRNDSLEKKYTRQAILQNAPVAKYQYFVVPKVIGN